ncbi:transcription initiation factor TFIID subunit 1 [Phlyctema vagabunda]|uniref:Transcription initiation factor TFIID subunit 1 n=1 Tax=Phlyctema vagabunda TaxID=108571 RepID=A0ABR4PPQ1_9HELO
MAAPTSSDSTTAMDWERQNAVDEVEMQRIINIANGAGDPNTKLQLSLNEDINARGEKADDAKDYEDLSDDDDDLPDEEEPSGQAGGDLGGDLPGLTDDTGTSHDNDLDDLFGEGPDSPSFDEFAGQDGAQQGTTAQEDFMDTETNELSYEQELAALREANFPSLNQAGNQDLSIPAPVESQSEFVKVLFPAFEEGAILNWNDLLPSKKAHYNPKVPLKEPKPVHPTKVSLEIAADQEKSFRTAGPATSDKRKRAQEAEAKGLIAIIEESSDEGESKEDFDWDEPSRSEMIGKFTWADLEIICDDWASKINPVVTDVVPIEPEDEPMDDWEREFLEPSAKRRKTVHHDESFITKPRYAVPSFDNFERATRLASKVILDLNDPYLLIDVHETNATRKCDRVGGKFKRGPGGSMAKTLSQRFNISNDEAYDALKENHQSKIRATLGGLAVEHSLPALKLVHPYYRVKLDTSSARAHHRPSFKCKIIGAPIIFSRPGLRKRKEVKGMATKDVFANSKDLSLADHYSTATLLEYSEEHPTVLSNFGMGNRIINYYRRKNAEDTYRPANKEFIGDSTILLPEDRSPFANFGSVDPGETVPTLHNAMYRAPIFKHEPKNTDFLVIRTTTGVGGSNWHMRNIDNLFVVGQQFPSVEIPGPHSRKVTNAAKNRMKMIAFRKIRHHSNQVLRIADLTAHIADSTDMQNRQKLKEFIQYNKEDKLWRMKQGEQVPDETTIRSMVKPEEICVIDAMQVGLQHLTDSGYAANDDDDEDEEGNEGENLEQNLAPWKTSKAFLEASADKAMLQLHGAGDPSGCGLAFSFIKTSMKGGYIGAVQGPSATSADAIARERKANGGHTYNVRKQQAAYNDAIRDIWEKQKSNLSDPVEHSENELEREQADEDERLGVDQNSHTMATPAGFDDSASQVSRFSNGSRASGRVMKITRTLRNKFGVEETVVEVVKDVRVWREYHKRRIALVADTMNVYEAKPTGDAEWDRQQALEAKKELARLERNKERRQTREKQKGNHQRGSVTAASPSSTPVPSTEKASGTTRKCANCGLAGHIKTNKKLCPLLNGTMKPEDSTPNHGGFGAITTSIS